MRWSSSQAGFTLVELLISMTVFAILLAIAIPSFKSATLNTQLRTAANGLVAGAALARSEAIKRNAAVTLCVSSDAVNCGAGNWRQGWIVACRSNDSVSCVAGGSSWLVLQNEGAAPDGLQITTTGSTDQVTFQPTGIGATATAFTICRSSPAGSQERVVTISSTGRAVARKTATGVCPS